MTQTLLCPWEPSTLLFFSSNVPALVHYSHLVALLAALTIAVYVFSSDPKGLVQRLFVLLISTFSLWVILDLILWATNRPDVVMFSWTLQILLEPLTYVVAFYLFYVFLYKKWPGTSHTLFVFILFLPITIFLNTGYNLGDLYISECEASEGPLAKYYTHFVHGALILSIAILALKGISRLASGEDRRIATLFALGLISFLAAFSSGTIVGSLTDDWVLSQYGLFGMPVFAACIAYSIIRYRAFNAKVVTAELLIVALSIAVLSLTALQTIKNVRIVAALTFVLVCVVGYVLVQNVRREIRLRIQIQAQEEALENINKQQEGLLRFISHEVKGYLTKGQAAFAGIAQGDYGSVTPELQRLAEGAIIDARKGVDMVADILDASNLKKGTVSYVKEPFDFSKSVEQVIQDLHQVADAKKISLSFAAASGSYVMEGDEAKIRRHVIRNLIDNAIHYTLHGEIQASLSRTQSSLKFSVKDTGVGITKEDMLRLFSEGGHGKDSTKVNIDSTGYGLYIAKQIVEAHHGTIQAFSQGAGHGSEFVVELPL